MFGNAPRALWSRWCAPDEQNRIPLACRALLIVEPNRRILLETGIGAFFEPSMQARYGVVESRHVLIEQLEALGHPHTSIDVVVLSHLHFDHAGGLLAAWQPDTPLELLFPRARFVVSRAAWARACDPHVRDRASYIPELQSLLEGSGRLQFVDGEGSASAVVSADAVLGDGYGFRFSDGHSPGMMLTEILTADGPILFAADLIPGTPWLRGAITMGYDRFPEHLIDEKSALLNEYIERKGRIFYTHDPKWALSAVGRDPKGQFVPEAPQSSLFSLEV
ncbi:MAG: MBL fold metallo-hydrolase [Deltaproteobacteria bacterium]|nr:MBL fold metallo-hydrolase [Deltaproteobacteria bacterium]